MDVYDERPWRRPIPAGEGEYGDFFAGCAEGKLLVQECKDCGHRQHYPRSLCTLCGGHPEFAAASGQGTVYTYTVVRAMRLEPFGEEVPYVIAMIDLPEGVRMMGQITGAEPSDIEIGSPVEAYARVYEDGRAVPFWRLADAAA